MSQLGHAIKPVTKVKLFSIKFDLDRTTPDRSIPAFLEFHITLLGVHLIRYQSTQRLRPFDRALNIDEIDDLVQDVMEDVEECLSDCDVKDHECIANASECKSQAYIAVFPLPPDPLTSFIDRDDPHLNSANLQNDFTDRDAV